MNVRAAGLLPAGLLPFAFLVAACPGQLVDRVAFGDGAPLAASGTVDCDTIETTLLASKVSPQGCAEIGCHNLATRAGGLDLQSPNIWGRLAGTNALVAPGVLLDKRGAPKKSVLYLMLMPN